MLPRRANPGVCVPLGHREIRRGSRCVAKFSGIFFGSAPLAVSRVRTELLIASVSMSLDDGGGMAVSSRPNWFRRLASADPTPDGELARRFHLHADQDAFELLIHRHAPTVLRVCR